MKKLIIPLVASLLSINVVFAQTGNDFISQPTHIAGKRINSSGDVTQTLESDFFYSENGKTTRFVFPDFALTTTYTYEGDFLTRESTSHQGGYPFFGESLIYTYENEKVKTITHFWEEMNENEYWQYDYYNDGRLKQKDYKEGYDGDYHQHYSYDYSEDGLTKIETYRTSWPLEGLLLRRRTTYQYDEAFRLTTVLLEEYNTDEALTNSTLTTYSYTPTGKASAEVTQTLVDGEWANTSIQRYVYNDSDQIIEQQNGLWQQDNGEWDITRKIIFDLSEDGLTYTVSFYKKNGDEWIWDMFNNQTILFEPLLKIQQRTLRYYVYEDMCGAGRINQFEITLEQTQKPVYLETEDQKQNHTNVYPNPGTDKINVLALAEDAVVRFYNVQGKMIHASRFDFQGEVDTRNWPSGIYFWEISQKNQRIASGKWIKE